MEKGEGKDGHEPDEETGCMSGRLKEIHDDDEAHDGGARTPCADSGARAS